MTADAPSLVRAVADSISNAQLQPRDRGTAVLAKRYAALIEEATPAATFGDALDYLESLIDPNDATGRRHFKKVRDALAAHSVASDFGPKLLTALTALGCNPSARSTVKGGSPDVPGSDGATAAAALDELRGRRAARKAGSPQG